MKKIHKMIPLMDNFSIQRYFSESYALFDIETTGFSPKNSFVYLIGMALRNGDFIHVYQFLAKNRKEEAEILSAFHQQLNQISTLVTFNGTGFDLPFLKAREDACQIDCIWDTFAFLDLYKLTGKLAHLFHLPDKKQKSVEQFLGIAREDRCSGGDLIPVYYTYEKQQDIQSEELLLLHNYEDVLGMTKLLSLLSYQDFFAAPAEVLHISQEKCRSYQNQKETSELLLTLKVPAPFPAQFLYQNDFCNLMCRETSAKLLVKIFQGELRFYYDNFKNYYYLPEEDTAIHKSVAAFVDTSHRKKATASTCYTKKSGCFLPQPEILFTPCFYPEKKGGISYFEMTDDFLDHPDARNAYAGHLLKYCCT